MSERLGPVAFGAERGAFLAAPGAPSRAEYSAETAVAVDQEMRELLEGVEARVHQLSGAHRSMLLAVAARLEQTEIMDGAELREIVDREKQKSYPLALPREAHA